jgi:hypothetical protein
MVVEYRGSDSLMPVGQLSSTLPVAGILGAMAAVALIAILRTFLIEVEGMSALQADALLWPLLAGVVCLGLGTGASVAPGLFSAAYCLPVKQIGRTFAVVELLRSAAAFLLAPVVLAIAMNGAGRWAGRAVRRLALRGLDRRGRHRGRRGDRRGRGAGRRRAAASPTRGRVAGRGGLPLAGTGLVRYWSAIAQRPASASWAIRETAACRAPPASMALVAPASTRLVKPARERTDTEARISLPSSVAARW